MLTKVKRLANDAFSALRSGTPIPIRNGSPPAHPGGPRRSCPNIDVAPRLSEVVATFTLVDATPSNTHLVWNEELKTLSLSVAATEERDALWAELAFGHDVNGSNGTARLNGDTLTVRLPRLDVDTLTGLPAWLQPRIEPLPAPLLGI
jgi:hypothetical protein